MKEIDAIIEDVMMFGDFWSPASLRQEIFAEFYKRGVPDDPSTVEYVEKSLEEAGV